MFGAGAQSATVSSTIPAAALKFKVTWCPAWTGPAASTSTQITGILGAFVALVPEVFSHVRSVYPTTTQPLWLCNAPISPVPTRCWGILRLPPQCPDRLWVSPHDCLYSRDWTQTPGSCLSPSTVLCTPSPSKAIRGFYLPTVHSSQPHSTGGAGAPCTPGCSPPDHLFLQHRETPFILEAWVGWEIVLLTRCPLCSKSQKREGVCKPKASPLPLKPFSLKPFPL